MSGREDRGQSQWSEGREVRLVIPQEHVAEALGAIRTLRAPGIGRSAGSSLTDLASAIAELGGRAEVTTTTLLGSPISSVDVAIVEYEGTDRLISTLRHFASQVTYAGGAFPEMQGRADPDWKR